VKCSGFLVWLGWVIYHFKLFEILWYRRWFLISKLFWSFHLKYGFFFLKVICAFQYASHGLTNFVDHFGRHMLPSSLA
jgi:hypothetical protein